ncbi:putative RNA-binding Zn-ribbon protein involved in translation (DUF1610 family) [Streptacidiphilus sp. MAP12-16]|jgi:hypothetical protein|uniref:DUF4282 domain-containing protein n=1 Tax=Streptacidiphilus sp. MAP12-16 TaxID=3156300 RepID=UPI003511B2C8
MSETVQLSCPNCGANVAQQDSFCSECGLRITPTNELIQDNPVAGTHGQARSDQDEKSNAGAPGGSSIPPVPPPYSPPSGFPSHPTSPSHTSTREFFAGLFDFGFTAFITPKAVKVVYVIIAILLALDWFAFLVVGFAYSAALGILVLTVGLVVALLWLVMYRILLEFVMMFFRIGTDVRAIKEQRDL